MVHGGGDGNAPEALIPLRQIFFSRSETNYYLAPLAYTSSRMPPMRRCLRIGAWGAKIRVGGTRDAITRLSRGILQKNQTYYGGLRNFRAGQGGLQHPSDELMA